jgi:hypothetical protein
MPLTPEQVVGLRRAKLEQAARLCADDPSRAVDFLLDLIAADSRAVEASLSLLEELLTKSASRLGDDELRRISELGEVALVTGGIDMSDWGHRDWIESDYAHYPWTTKRLARDELARRGCPPAPLTPLMIHRLDVAIASRAPESVSEVYDLVDRLSAEGGIDAARAVAKAWGAGRKEYVGFHLYRMGEVGLAAAVERLPDLAEWVMEYCTVEYGQQGLAAAPSHVRKLIVDRVSDLLADADARKRDRAVKLISHIGGPWEILEPLINDEDKDVRLEVAQALGPRRLRGIGHPGWAESISRQFPSWDQMVGTGTMETLPLIERALSVEPDFEVKAALRGSLERLRRT